MGRFQYAKAAELFAELAEQFPEWAEVHINLALVQLNEDQGGQRAEPTLAKVLKTHPDHVAANYCMGVVLVHGSHTAAAPPYLEKSLRGGRPRRLRRLPAGPVRRRNLEG